MGLDKSAVQMFSKIKILHCCCLNQENNRDKWAIIINWRDLTDATPDFILIMHQKLDTCILEHSSPQMTDSCSWFFYFKLLSLHLLQVPVLRPQLHYFNQRANWTEKCLLTKAAAQVTYSEGNVQSLHKIDVFPGGTLYIFYYLTVLFCPPPARSCDQACS